MIRLTKASRTNGEEMAQFIADLNILEENHIGYCGSDKDEIFHSLLEDMEDRPFEDNFVLAYEENHLIGLIGFDPDLESRNAEIWGPFINHMEWQAIAKDMWEYLLRMMPKDITTLSLFVNVKNQNVIEFVRKLKLDQTISQHTILKSRIKQQSNLSQLDELQEEDVREMVELHNLSFPNSYYTGNQIVDRINDVNKVFVYKENDRFIGYIYIEAQPEFGEGSIEFFSVKEEYRGKGIGKKLLKSALNWLFSFEEIEHIQLTVNSENQKAIKLYQAVGFSIEDELYYFKKDI